MRKSFLCLLSLLVLLFSGGFSFVVSFCPMSEEWSMAFFSDKACSCVDEEEEDCCDQTVIKLNKIKDNFFPSDLIKLPSLKQLMIFNFNGISFLFHDSVQTCNSINVISDDPPDSVPSFIFNRALII